MLQKLLSYIREHRLLRPGDRVGIAVSGGADSVALLRGIMELRRELGLVVAVVHVHHGIRGHEADADVQFVESMSHEHGLDLHVLRAEVPAIARDRHLSLEAAGRSVRYEYFKKLILQGILDKVATAHTFDDQAETVLLRILRGAGLQGIAGIYPALDKGVVRPLLSVTRAEVIEYLQRTGQAWREDATNSDTKFLRNRVRHELLPLLERNYNRGVKDVLNNLAETARADSELLREYASAAESELLDPELLRLSVDGLLKLPLALQRRVLISAARQITGKQPTFEEVEDLRKVAAGEVAGRSIAGAYEARRIHEADNCFLELRAHSEKYDTAVADGYEYLLSIPGEVYVAESGDRIRAIRVEAKQGRSNYNLASSLDASLLKNELTLRNWRPGDRYRPLHAKSSEKLKRLFQEKKVPPRDRLKWPVLLSGKDIVWVRGLGVAAEFAAKDASATAVVIESERPSKDEYRTIKENRAGTTREAEGNTDV